MRNLLVIIFTLAVLAVNAQKRDTVIVRDTVPVLLYQITDTIPVTYLYEGNGSAVFKATGFALVTGFKIQQGKELKWVQEPRLAGVLDSRRRPVKKVLQILN